MEQSTKDILAQAQAKKEVSNERAEFCQEVQRVILEQAEMIATLEEKLRNNDGLAVDWPVLRKVFLLGAGYGATYQTSYVKNEMSDYEADVYTSVNDNGMYAEIQGTYTLEADELTDHIKFQNVAQDDFKAVQEFLGMDDDELNACIDSYIQRPIKSTDNEAQQSES
mgnify:FL=1